MRKFMICWSIILCCLMRVAMAAPALAQKQSPTQESKDVELQRANALYEQTIELYTRGKYDEAIPLAEQALEILERLLDIKYPKVAHTMIVLGLLHSSRGEYDRAEPLYRRALAILEKELGQDHPEIAGLLANLANLHSDRGEYEKAALLDRRALAILEKTLGKDHPKVASALNNLGVLHKEQGEYDKAEPLYRRALVIREKALGKDHLDVAMSLNNLAILHLERGEYDKAEPLYRRALETSEKALGKNHPRLAMFLQNLAILHKTRGEYHMAQSLYQRALVILENSLGKSHPKLSLLLNNLGNLYLERREYDKAEPLYRQALAIRENALGKEHPYVASSVHGLAQLLQARGEYDKAEPLYRQALTIRENALGKDHSAVAMSLNSLAELHQEQGEYDKAEPLFRRALALWENALGKDHPYAAIPMSKLASLHSARREKEAALRFYEQTLQVYRYNLRLQLRSGSEGQKQNRMAKLDYSAMPLSFHLHIAPQNPRAAALAMNAIVMHKGRVLDAMADSMRAARERLDENSRARLDRLQRLQSELAHLFHQGPGTDKVALDHYMRRRITLEREIDTIDAEIARLNPAYRTLAKDVRVVDIQAALPQDAALLEVFIYRPYTFHAPGVKDSERHGEPHYAAYVVHRDGPVRGIVLGPVARIDAVAQAFQESVANHRADFAQHARALDAMIMEPVRAFLGNARRLHVAPDGHLSLVSFAALMNEQGQYLIQRYSLTYLASGRDLVHKLPSLAPRSAPLIIADPRFDLVHSPMATTAMPITSKYDALRRSSDHPCQPVSPLPGTRAEAHALSAALGNVLLWTQDKATETALYSVHGPSILHIATHAFFLPDQDITRDTDAMAGFSAETDGPRAAIENGLLRSGLLLAGASQCRDSNNLSGARDDGVLTALEASSLDLRGTRLVVLSACETGMGEVNIGRGIYGLRRAFAVAGAETLVMSLWRVSDAGTAYLMRHYYDNLRRGHGRSEAMRAVQLDLIAEGGQRAHPFYWASFIVSGDDSTLNGKPPRLPAQPGTTAGCAGCASNDFSGSAWLLALVTLLAWRKRSRADMRAA